MSHDSVTKPHDRWGAVTEPCLAYATLTNERAFSVFIDQSGARTLSPVSALAACLQVVQCIVPGSIRLAPGGYMTQTA